MQLEGEVKELGPQRSDNNNPDGGHIGESSSVPELNILVHRTESYYLSHRALQTG